jgi:cellulose synthase/poly-beta-1,6-N-acetylglucosamine synthase-like glycosyltransferase
MTLALEIIFWVSCALIVWTQVGYALALAGIARVLPRAASEPRERTRRSAQRGGPKTTLSQSPLPALSLIIAAHDEQTVIAAKVHNALALDYPRELLQVIVACDGCTDQTAAQAREAGADLVLELARGGKIRAQDAAVQQARGEIVAFSDANALWEPDAAQTLVGAFEDPKVGYACGQVRFVRATGAAGSGTVDEGTQIDVNGQSDAGARADAGAPNQEGVYWRYEMVVRALESRLSSITAGNGAIYATRRTSYIVVDPIMGHDLSLPFNMVKRGLRAVYVPDARAQEKMVPSLAGEFARKRRMMSHTWPIVLRGGMLSPRGYPPGYALMILSHRLLRYSTAALHTLALAANIALVVLGAGVPYVVTLDLQIALLLAAALAGLFPLRPLLIARYYVLTTASLAAGWWDWVRRGTEATWDAAEGTR